jgi:starch synthase (maltosyl-transferring)
MAHGDLHAGGTRSPASGKADSASRARKSASVSTEPLDLRAWLEGTTGQRIAIEAVRPQVDGGRFSAKALVGEPVRIEADIFGDGHDRIAAAVRTRAVGASGDWTETPMALVDNDRWAAEVRFDENRRFEFTLIAWRDPFATWRGEVSKKHAAGLDLSLELDEGVGLVEAAVAAGRAIGPDRESLDRLLAALRSADGDGGRFSSLMAEETFALMSRAAERADLSELGRVLEIFVDRERAGFAAWYEMMPRSQSGSAERHGTFDDVIARLPYVRDMGFDVLYFPPIHPIGRTNRKGANNSLTAGPGDPGSPYAIGAGDGGHDAIHAELGTFDDFERLVDAAARHGLEIALDFAVQCSPDHPWVAEHPEWFDWRPDGTIKFAENPPKKYEDIVNVHFYGESIPDLWYALRDIVLFWITKGVRIFRVDNPHTKPFPFWEWMIAQVRADHPDTVFLAEAFTRPKIMKRLAKLGFTQSYSYFTWRNAKQELQDYMVELTQSESSDYMRPNFFTNTPDINPYYLQSSGRAGFRARFVLAATLAGNYGIYNGFELCEAAAIAQKEEYLDSEKYEIRAWDWDRPGHIRDDIRLVNGLRREHEALKRFTNLAFYHAWNDNIIYYGKRSADRRDFLLFAVNLDPHQVQSARFEVPLWEFGLADDASIEVEDMVTGRRFVWQGKVQEMRLDPAERPYAIWRLVTPGASL